VSWLAVVVPLKEGSRERALALLSGGPPFALEDTKYTRHNVFLTHRELVFVFEVPGEGEALQLPREDLALWKPADAWGELLAETPRVAQERFSWTRSPECPGFSYESTPGPGDSEGGDLFRGDVEPARTRPGRRR
jgi:hypothetical protein